MSNPTYPMLTVITSLLGKQPKTARDMFARRNIPDEEVHEMVMLSSVFESPTTDLSFAVLKYLRCEIPWTQLKSAMQANHDARKHNK